MPRTSVNADRHVYDAEGPLASAFAVVLRRPLDSIAAMLAFACTVMIFVNALVLQQGRAPVQPADRPLTSAEPARAQPRVDAPKRSDLVEQVQTALAERGLYEGVVDGLHGSGTAAAIRAFEQSRGMAPTGEASERLLAALLTAPMRGQASAQPRPASPAPAPAAGTAPASTKLLAVQRALAKIGYGPSVIDGRMGAETRNAIKAFERDRGMAETGEPSPQMLRALQAMTGAPLQ